MSITKFIYTLCFVLFWLTAAYRLSKGEYDSATLNTIASLMFLREARETK